MDNVLNDDDLERELDEDFKDVEPIVSDGDDNELFISDASIKNIDDDFEKNLLEGDTSKVLLSYLESKGIKEGKILLEEEDGTKVETSFSELPEEEQLELLNSLEKTGVELNESEQKAVDLLREKKVSLDEYLSSYKEEILKENITEPVKTYDTDAYTDKELFLIDLKNKYDLTDDELTQELERELTNEALFTKKVTKIREEYKDLEDAYIAQEKVKEDAKQADDYAEFVDKVTDIANKSTDLYGIELEDSEKQEVLSYLLDLDENGTSEFYKNLDSPEKLYEVSWFLKYGKEAFEATRSAYEEEIARLKKATPEVVIKRKSSNKKIKSIYDI